MTIPTARALVPRKSHRMKIPATRKASEPTTFAIVRITPNKKFDCAGSCTICPPMSAALEMEASFEDRYSTSPPICASGADRQHIDGEVDVTTDGPLYRGVDHPAADVTTDASVDTGGSAEYDHVPRDPTRFSHGGRRRRREQVAADLTLHGHLCRQGTHGSLDDPVCRQEHPGPCSKPSRFRSPSLRS